jgi:hypothetical protein
MQISAIKVQCHVLNTHSCPRHYFSLNSLLNSMLGTMTFSQILVSVFWSSNRCL